MRWLDDITDFGHELGQTLGGSKGQGRLLCNIPWGCRVGHDLVTK